ncbi:MAG: NUDIX hydrolase [Bacteroidetes Order II. Incertae sedis bacterium]|nr:NUDIX hydrolase [Bacteroidetes Order II. bacterium]
MEHFTALAGVWTLLKRKYWYESKHGNLRQDHVRLPNGAEILDYMVMEYADWSGVLCITEEGHILTVTQYRHGAALSSIEFPAGMVDAGETPFEAAQRELLEETGYVAEAWQPLMTCFPEPVKQTNQGHLFVARKAKKVSEPQTEATESLHIHAIAPDILFEWAMEGKVIHAVYQAAIFKARLMGII